MGQALMTMIGQLRSIVAPAVDYALPPRCPACGTIVSETGAFCADCWRGIDFLAEPLCATCGAELPGAATEPGMSCGACLADPPPFDRARAVMRYGEVGRAIAHRLKYARRVSLARVMAAQMARLLPAGPERGALLVPVPLHRWRIWSRGFNQAALVTRELSRRAGLPVALDLLRRTVNTPPLHSLGPRARRSAVKGAFALAPGARARIAGRTILLVDDIWTTGATASACAKLLKAGGAARVEVICWTRAGTTSD
jgi:ComF family protein